MLTAAIYLIIQVLVLVLVVYLVLYILTSVAEVALPPKIIQIIWVIVGLVVLLMLVNFITGGAIYRPLL